MIRINLLAVERERARRRASFQLAEKVTVACSLILVASAVFIGWWYWSIGRQEAELDQNIAAAQRETARLRVIIQKVQQFEQRRAQLEQRVTLIEQLRKEQSAPVHLLDEVSRAVPDGLWLTGMTQKDSEIRFEGRCLTLNALSEFITNVEASPYFRKPVEEVASDTEKVDQNQPEVLKFSFKARFAAPGT
jgi:type IV pilus assembly protein PilN